MLGGMIRKHVHNRALDRDLSLQTLLFLYQTIPLTSLGFSPFEVMFGGDVMTPVTVVRSCWEGHHFPAEKVPILDFVDQLQNVRESLSFAHENQGATWDQYWYEQKAR